MNDEAIISSLQLVKSSFRDCPNIAVETERVVRNETAHFTSYGWLKALCPGMEAFAPDYPYEWTSLKSFWDNNNQFIPMGIVPMVESSSAMMESRGERNFIQFADTDSAFMAVATVLYNRRNANGTADAGEWFSNRPDAVGVAARAKYDAVADNITPHFCIDNNI